MSAVDNILNFEKSDDDDFYKLLNCNENSSVEQITTEYKVLALEFHPDKNEGNKDAEVKFQKLKQMFITSFVSVLFLSYQRCILLPILNSAIVSKIEAAKEVLCDPEKRCNYDKWRNSGISISYRQWLGMKEHVQQTMHWSTPKTKDRMLPDAAGSSGPASLGAGGITSAQRRASEGGANLHWQGRGTGAPWGSEAPSEVVNKFRNYEI